MLTAEWGLFDPKDPKISFALLNIEERVQPTKKLGVVKVLRGQKRPHSAIARLIGRMHFELSLLAICKSCRI